MKISDDKLKLFDNEGDLRNYLKINGQSGNAIEQSVIDGKILILKILRVKKQRWLLLKRIQQ